MLILTTAILLQILSNLANDLGDSIHGADSEMREGPKRAVQSGRISKKAMKNGVVIASMLTLLSGFILLYISFNSFSEALPFLALGLLCIAAAVLYTNSKNPYGYIGLGDLSVVVFFGLIAVSGSLYLFTKTWITSSLLPAMAIGLLCAGVLNVNNMRDIESDRLAGKKSIPVRLGFLRAKTYHAILIYSAWLLMCFYSYIEIGFSGWRWLFLLTLPLFIWHLKMVRARKSQELDPLLKQLALSTLLMVILFGFWDFVLGPG